jgi:hypothetical protein
MKANPTTTGRPVQIYSAEFREGVRHCVPEYNGRGTFHCWSTAHEEYESGAATFTVAVVEMPDGWVRVVAADLVRFLDSERIQVQDLERQMSALKEEHAA